MGLELTAVQNVAQWGYLVVSLCNEFNLERPLIHQAVNDRVIDGFHLIIIDLTFSQPRNLQPHPWHID